jgi:hypothetical protein
MAFISKKKIVDQPLMPLVGTMLSGEVALGHEIYDFKPSPTVKNRVEN